MQKLKWNCVEFTQLQAKFLFDNLLNSTFLSAFRISNKEYHFYFEDVKNKKWQLKLLFEYQNIFLVLNEEFKEANSYLNKIFASLNQHKINKIQAIENDRIIQFYFDNQNVLEFKLFGRNSNIIQYSNLKTVVETLIYSLKSDSNSILNTENGIDLKLFEFTSLNQKWAELNIEPKNNLSLIEWNKIQFEFIKSTHFSEKKELLIRNQLSKIKKLEKSIESLSKAIKSSENQLSKSQIADILMANIHIKNDIFQNKITLFNFYKNDEIEIKLNVGKSLIWNAENYYNKSVNEKLRNETDIKRLFQLEEDLVKSRIELIDFETIESFKQLKSTDSIPKKETSKNETSFKEFELNSYKIYIGKNAANNDELLRFSSKNDVWLHAKGCSGSHVIIRNSQKEFPDNQVLEYAASLAAYYSKNSGSEFVPVAYTFRKFVRKPKKANPGEVLVEKEKIILVKPHKPS